ncbi:MAG: autoinducer binding domain-containing protein [Betaproteobacteria bacterium]
MDKNVYEHCIGVLNAKSAATFSGRLVSFARSLGFTYVAASVITDHSASLTEFQTITNAPPKFLDDYHDLDKAVKDPVSQHCKHRSFAIMWDQGTYTGAGMGEFWESQASFGYKHGIATATHYQNGRHFMIGLNGEHGLPKDPREAKVILRNFQTFAAYAQAAAFDLCLPPKTKPHQRTLLTAREIDALRWTMDGKTAMGVAASMATSDEVAESRIRSAMQKLNCASKYEAVLKAIRFGLIHCD